MPATTRHDTDQFWRKLGEEDPYWGVLTRDEFRANSLTTDAVDDLYSTGEEHISFVCDVIRKYLDPGFAPTTALDFGCGVGRLVVPLATRFSSVVGVDVSEGMLRKAQERCHSLGLSNVRFVCDAGQFAGLTETFDLVHSFIVFQHIPCPKGEAIVDRLLELLNDGGVGVLHFTYHVLSQPRRARLRRLLEKARLYRMTCHLRNLCRSFTSRLFGNSWNEPEMQMNPYSLNAIFVKLHHIGARGIHAQITDHGGNYGVTLFFQKCLRTAQK